MPLDDEQACQYYVLLYIEAMGQERSVKDFRVDCEQPRQ